MARTLAWLLAVAATGSVVVGSLLPDLGGAVERSPGGDKGAHLFAYAVLVLCWLPAILGGVSARAGYRRILAAAAAVVALGWVLELVQGWYARTPSIGDGVANLAGAVIGAALGSAVWARLGSSRPDRDTAAAASRGAAPGEGQR